MARRKDQGPRPYEIAIAACLSLIVGVLGAAVYLALIPPEEVSEIPEEEDRRLARVYYVPGSAGTREHGTWEAKQAAIESGRSGSFSFVEGELNLWARNFFSDEEETKAGPVLIKAGRPNFRVDEELQINLDLDWSAFGMERDFVSLATGEFVERRGQHVFRPRRVYIGSCPVPGIFGLAQKAFGRVASAYEIPAELREGWEQLASVEIEEEELKVTIP